MRTALPIAIVFLGGFAIMVLEIVGARYLLKDFGSSLYVWISQIGVVLIALSLGYYFGGVLGDRFVRASILGWLLIPAGALAFFIPDYAAPVIDWVVLRHPAEQDIPLLWQKLDPMIGSALIFLAPCLVLAMLSPWTIRLLSEQIAHVGRISGKIYAASTVGSIAGVFISGYILLDHFDVTDIIRGTGLLTALLGGICLLWDRWLLAHLPLSVDLSPRRE
jgi:MFS family permease